MRVYTRIICGRRLKAHSAWRSPGELGTLRCSVHSPWVRLEHRISGNRKAWNKNGHRRKFLQQRGSYVKARDTVGPETGDLVFWGEWEPESDGVQIVSPLPNGPRWVHRPFYVRPASYRNLQNTDPFAFGDRFLYTFCRQTKLAFLRDLAPGSLILFGSLKGGESYSIRHLSWLTECCTTPRTGQGFSPVGFPRRMKP